MGTRHLTIVKKDYETKVAQYGQWDGDPQGAGKTIINFLRNVDLGKFKEKVNACHFMPEQTIDKMNEKQWLELCQNQPQFSRDTGANVLQMIAESDKQDFELRDASVFGFNDLSCEWLYLIDLDHNKLYVRHNLVDPFCVEYELEYLPESLDGLDYAK